MYYVVFPRRYDSHDDCCVIGKFDTLKEATNNRKAAGDVVVDHNGNIVQSDEWLYDWEKAKSICFAKQCQRFNLSVSQEIKKFNSP